jgi:hypothetical protein
MASTAILMISIESDFSTLDDLLPLIKAAVPAHAVGQLGFGALRADGQPFHLQGIVGSPFIFPGMGMSSFRLGHFSPLYFFEQKLYFIFCFFAGAGALVQVGAATGAYPLAAGMADGFEGNKEIDLFDQEFFQVDLVVLEKNIFQLFFFKGRAAQVGQFLGKKDDVKAGVDLEFELFQAADACQRNGGFDLPLGLDALVFPFEEYLVVEPFQEKTLVFQQKGAVQIDGVVQRIALLINSVDIDDHWFLFFQLNRQAHFYNTFQPRCQTPGMAVLEIKGPFGPARPGRKRDGRK